MCNMKAIICNTGLPKSWGRVSISAQMNINKEDLFDILN